MTTQNKIIDLDQELKAIELYLTQTWDGFDKLDSHEFLAQIWSQAHKKIQHDFRPHELLEFTDSLQELSKSDILINDNIKSSELFYMVLISASKLKDTIEKQCDFHKVVSAIMREIKSNFPEYTYLKPQGWEELAQNYSDHDGMGEDKYEIIKKSFKGRVLPVNGTPLFEISVSLPHVMYDDKCQGRKPIEVLVGAIVSRSCALIEINNSHKMVVEWQELITQLQQNTSDTLQFEFKEPLNQALEYIIANNKLGEEYNEDNVLKILGINTGNNKKLKNT